MATRKTTPKQTTEQSEAAPKRPARKTAKIIRNLRGAAVHLRLYSENPKDPYRIQLAPRGHSGDYTTVPVKLVDDPTLIRAVNGGLVEVVTQAEVNALQESYGPVGYVTRTDAPQIVRPDDTTILSAPDWDGKGRLPQDRRTSTGKQASEREFGTGTHTVDVPGSDQALHQMLKAGQSAMPSEASFDRNVSIERAKGETNQHTLGR